MVAWCGLAGCGKKVPTSAPLPVRSVPFEAARRSYLESLWTLARLDLKLTDDESRQALKRLDGASAELKSAGDWPAELDRAAAASAIFAADSSAHARVDACAIADLQSETTSAAIEAWLQVDFVQATWDVAVLLEPRRPAWSKGGAILELATDLVRLWLGHMKMASSDWHREASVITSRIPGLFAAHKDLTHREKDELLEMLAMVQPPNITGYPEIRDLADKATALTFPAGSGPAGLPAWR